MARTAEEINLSIQKDFEDITGRTFRPGSAIGFYTNAVSKEMEQAHLEIDRNKNPHIYTNLEGDNLDKMGTFVNVPRETDESDTNYLYRIMNWTYLKAGANYTAVNDSLLNMEYASNAEYYPGIYGAGTGVVYVIPNEYSEETMQKALAEAKDRASYVLSPESYTEFIIPTAISVTVIAHLETTNQDLDYLKTNIATAIKNYINDIAPNDYLSIGTINRIVLNMNGVDFFAVDGLYLDDTYTAQTKVLQELETKLLFKEIDWEE